MGNIDCGRLAEHNEVAKRAKEGVLSASDLAQVSRIFQLLSDPGRLNIVYALMKGEMCAYHLTEVCGGTVSAVSHQLRILRENGILKSKRLGKHIEYSIADHHVCEIIELAVAHLACEVNG